MKNELRNKIERMKMKADIFLKEDKKVFIKDINNQIFMGDILFVGDNSIEIETFAPPEKKNQKFQIYWVDITLFEDYKNREELKQ